MWVRAAGLRISHRPARQDRSISLVRVLAAPDLTMIPTLVDSGDDVVQHRARSATATRRGRRQTAARRVPSRSPALSQQATRAASDRDRFALPLCRAEVAETITVHADLNCALRQRPPQDVRGLIICDGPPISAANKARRFEAVDPVVRGTADPPVAADRCWTIRKIANFPQIR